MASWRWSPPSTSWRVPWKDNRDAASSGDRRSGPDGGDGPPPDAAVRDRHPLRSPHPLSGLRGADARLPAPLRARLRRGGRGARAAAGAPRSGRARSALRAAGGAAAPRGQVRAAGRGQGAARGAGAAAAAAGPPDSGEAAGHLPDAAGRHADDHRLGPRRRAARPIRSSTCARTRWSTAAAWRPRSRARWRCRTARRRGRSSGGARRP